jgi:hypothetical protein
MSNGNVQIVSSVDDGSGVSVTAVNTDTGKSSTVREPYSSTPFFAKDAGSASGYAASKAVNKVS